MLYAILLTLCSMLCIPSTLGICLVGTWVDEATRRLMEPRISISDRLCYLLPMDVPVASPVSKLSSLKPVAASSPLHLTHRSLPLRTWEVMRAASWTVISLSVAPIETPGGRVVIHMELASALLTFLGPMNVDDARLISI